MAFWTPAKRCSRRQASCPSSIAALRTPRSACSSATSPSNVFDLATADSSLVECSHAGPQDPPPSRWPSQSPRRDLSSSGTEHHDSKDARGELCECSRMFLLGETSDHRHYFELFEVRRCPQTSARDFLEQRAPRPGSSSLRSKRLGRVRQHLQLVRKCLRGTP